MVLEGLQNKKYHIFGQEGGRFSIGVNGAVISGVPPFTQPHSERHYRILPPIERVFIDRIVSKLGFLVGIMSRFGKYSF